MDAKLISVEPLAPTETVWINENVAGTVTPSFRRAQK